MTSASSSFEILMENFDTIAKAKGGVAKLRETILQLAVQGRLVPQDSEDEPASVLLEKIAAEKSRLVKEGKIKKRKPLPPVDEDEVPYDLPDGWEWTKIGEIILNISNGYSGKQNKDVSNIPITRIETISNEIIDLSRVGYVHDIPLTEMEKFQLENKDILFSHINSDKHLGKTAIYDLDETLYHGTNLLLIRKLHDFLSSEFLNIVFKHLRYSGYFISIAQHAIHQSSINQQKVKNTLFPLPPLAEQHRIVERVDALMRLCDELEERQEAETERKQRLLLSSLGAVLDTENPEANAAAREILNENFDTLFDDLESIVEMRKSVLQLAVQGRLVPQDSEDEPASVLLEKIAAEKAKLVKEGKIKKGKPLPPVDEDEVPYDLPEGWVWTRLENVSFKIGDLDHKMPEECSLGIPYISPRDFTNKNGIDFVNSKKISNEDYQKLRQKIEPEEGDIIFPRYGTIGENRFVDTDQVFLVSYSCALIKPFKEEMAQKYVFNYSLSPLVKKEIEHNINKTTQPNVGIKSIKNFIFPLPPLAEQHRIVERVDALMKLCDELEERVSAREEAAERLVLSVCGGICG